MGLARAADLDFFVCKLLGDCLLYTLAFSLVYVHFVLFSYAYWICDVYMKPRNATTRRTLLATHKFPCKHYISKRMSANDNSLSVAKCEW